MEVGSELKMDVRVGSDWPGRPEMKLTSGRMMISRTVVELSKTQATRALSAAEAL